MYCSYLLIYLSNNYKYFLIDLSYLRLNKYINYVLLFKSVGQISSGSSTSDSPDGPPHYTALRS